MGFDSRLSSDDEEDNVRHDRFKSERFQKESSQSSRIREDNFSKSSDLQRHGSSRHRERSPRASHRHREVVSFSSSSYRNKSKYETRNDHDRKDRSKKSYSRSNKSDRNGSKHSSRVEKEDSSIKTKKNLSSLLKSFDKQAESKRSISDNPVQPSQEIGPALPPHLKEKMDSFSDNDKEKQPEKSIVDSVLATNNSSNAQTDGIESDNPSNNSAVELSQRDQISRDTEYKDNVGFVEGPVLPPHLQNSVKEDCISSITDNQETSSHTSSPTNHLDNSGPILDSCLSSKLELETYGPALPPKIESSAYGPALPPKTESGGTYGPTLPPEFKVNVEQALSSDIRVEQDEESEDDEDLVGPLPEGKMNMTQYQLDIRAASLKRKLEEEKSGSSKDIKKREEWMLELPPEKASNLGLGPRNFRKRDAPDMSNRSDWTDTPADRLRKAELAKCGIPIEPENSEEAMKSAFVKERNEVMDKISKQSREEDRPKSLLELHQKKLKKKKKKEEKDGKKKERRPFDRNIDLQVNRFDDAQKKAIYKKAQLLDSRFSTGESKYL